MFILDTCAFLTQKHPDGKCITIPEIKGEIINRQSKLYFENLLSSNLKIMDPGSEACHIVKKCARNTGDIDVLSKIDINIRLEYKYLEIKIIN